VADGTESASGRRRVRRRRVGRIVALVAAAGVAILAASALAVWCSLPDVTVLAATNPTTTAFIELRKAEAAGRGKPLELRWTWKPLARVSPYLRDAVVHSEDPHFFSHDGIDWKAVQAAAKADWKAGAMRYGASTITQQVAKNLYLSPSKNPLRKLREWLIAGRLEDALGKDRILEIYVNIAEWGDGVFGAEAAARRWFGRSAAELTPVQAARLAVALPNPRTRAPNVRSKLLARKAANLVIAMRSDGVIDGEAMQAALVELGVAKRAAGGVVAPVEPEPGPGAGEATKEPEAEAPTVPQPEPSAPDAAAAAPDAASEPEAPPAPPAPPAADGAP
jgi:monofunctional biosynthetic peptidoglycan transglycosylase